MRVAQSVDNFHLPATYIIHFHNAYVPIFLCVLLFCKCKGNTYEFLFVLLTGTRTINGSLLFVFNIARWFIAQCAVRLSLREPRVAQNIIDTGTYHYNWRTDTMLWVIMYIYMYDSVCEALTASSGCRVVCRVSNSHSSSRHCVAVVHTVVDTPTTVYQRSHADQLGTPWAVGRWGHGRSDEDVLYPSDKTDTLHCTWSTRHIECLTGVNRVYVAGIRPSAVSLGQTSTNGRTYEGADTGDGLCDGGKWPRTSYAFTQVDSYLCTPGRGEIRPRQVTIGHTVSPRWPSSWVWWK